MMTATYAGPTHTRQKEEGSIASVFSSLSGDTPTLPQRFLDLKKDIWTDSLSQSWREVCDELRGVVEEIAERGPDVLSSAFSCPPTLS